jgi:hypothetical protein
MLAANTVGQDFVVVQVQVVADLDGVLEHYENEWSGLAVCTPVHTLHIEQVPWPKKGIHPLRGGLGTTVRSRCFAESSLVRTDFYIFFHNFRNCPVGADRRAIIACLCEAARGARGVACARAT